MIFLFQLSGLRSQLRAEVSAHQGFREYQPGLLDPQRLAGKKNRNRNYKKYKNTSLQNFHYRISR